MRSRLDMILPARIRAAALMPAAVLTVHQLRYQLAFGGHTDTKLASEGHSYLGAVAPLAAMLVAIAAGVFIAGLARARRDGEAGQEGRSFLFVWMLAAATLIGIYAVQELVEGMLAPGHPAGLLGVFGEGGLWAVPLAVALGAVVAVALRVAAAAKRWVASLARDDGAPVASRPRRWLRPAPIFMPALAPLALAAAGRAPPAAAPVLSR
ncbi:MAG: hypothetical protein JST31_10515 [Actinobacteria bacterium]|nr:hypothetical protein [Actinomycetota bacterium]